MVTCYVDDFGNLCDLKTGDEIRAATEEETLASVNAAKADGGIGAIEVDEVLVDYSAWWQGVFGQRGATEVVEEFDLVDDGLGEWLAEAEAAARCSGAVGLCPGAFIRALAELEAIVARNA